VKKYTIYKTTNKINNKSYIGCHITVNPDDNYLGSGVLIKKAIQKYSKENFNKEVLYVAESIEKMFEKEIELIKELQPEYNLHEGGWGGFTNYNLYKKDYTISSQTEAGKKKRSKYWKQYYKNNPDEAQKMIDRLKKAREKRLKDGTFIGSFKGKKHSPETIEKMRRAAKGRTPWNKGKTHSKKK